MYLSRSLQFSLFIYWLFFRNRIFNNLLSFKKHFYDLLVYFVFWNYIYVRAKIFLCIKIYVLYQSPCSRNKVNFMHKTFKRLVYDESLKENVSWLWFCRLTIGVDKNIFNIRWKLIKCVISLLYDFQFNLNLVFRVSFFPLLDYNMLFPQIYFNIFRTWFRRIPISKVIVKYIEMRNFLNNRF